MKLQVRALITLIFFLSVAGTISAETRAPEVERYPLPLVFPVFDGPYTLEDGYSFPSMDQSLMLCKNIGQVAHSVIIDGSSGLDTPLGRWLPYLLTGAFDYLYFYLPPGYAWLHEEWHRAVMGRRGISSYNDVYNFDLFAESIAVSHVKDDDLVALKLHHPADMVRLHAAGNEADIELTLAMRRDSFFTGRPVRYDLISWWFNLSNAWAYIHLCTTSEADRLTDESNAEDGTDMSRRDFTGLDFTAWVYDLFRPEEPYAARGVHPSGTGIDRYIRYSDLTAEEKDYLKLQRNLALLNFLSPQMIGINRFAFRDPFTGGALRFNFAVTHHLTCFGYDAAAHLFFSEGDISLAVTPHLYANRERNLPGLDISLVRYRIDTAPLTFFASATAVFWLQPRDLMFRENSARPGGLFRIAFAFPAGDRVEFHLQGEAKTSGWYAGVVYLDAAFQAQAGVNLLW